MTPLFSLQRIVIGLAACSIVACGGSEFDEADGGADLATASAALTTTAPGLVGGRYLSAQQEGSGQASGGASGTAVMPASQSGATMGASSTTGDSSDTSPDPIPATGAAGQPGSLVPTIVVTPTHR